MALIAFETTAVLAGANDPVLTGVTDLAILPDPDGDILCTVAPDGGLATWRITDTGLEPIDTAGLPAGSVAGVAPGIETVETDAGTTVLVTGTGAGGVWSAPVDAAGGLGGATAVAGGVPADLAVSVTVSLGSESYVVGARQGSEEPGLWRLAGDGSLAQVAAPPAGSDDLAGLIDMEVAEIGGRTFVLGAAATAQAIVAWEVSERGLTETGRLDAASGVGIATPAALATVELGGDSFALLGAAGSSSLSVARLDAAGGLTLTDHILDSADTRFQGITTLDTATLNGRVYVAAAGGDDGLSLFELLPGGWLLHLGTLADTADTTLANISDLTLSATASDLQIAVASAAEPGLTLLSAEVSAGGAVLTGTGGALEGTGAGDLLQGGAAADAIAGGAGADVLRDGAGADTLTGGAGADVFVLAADDAVDVITDFEVGTDRLDLSAWVLLRGADQLTVLEQAYGAEIWYGAERLILQTADGRALSAADIAALDILGVDRLLPDWAETVTDPAPLPPGDPAQTGTGGADFMDGGSGENAIEGMGGNDTLRGGAGADALWGNAGSDVLEGADGADHLDGGIGADTMLGGAGRDTLEGKDGHDVLQGGAGDDWLQGNAGSDLLEGAGGADLLQGGIGADTMLGGAGRDTLEGKDGFDLLQGGEGDDLLQGNAGADTLEGGAGNDTLEGGQNFDLMRGGDGADSLAGKAGGDTLEGGAGNDMIEGGDGADLLRGGDGDDVLNGGINFDRVEGGAGDDRLEGMDGYDTLLGGDGDDTIEGNAGWDTLFGEAGDDVLAGGLAPDWADGGSGNDTLTGQDGADTLLGGAGADRLDGGAGPDSLDGGAGDDWLSGGQGADVFVFSGGHDTLADVSTIVDTVAFDSAVIPAAEVDAALAAARPDAAGVTLDFGAAGSLQVDGVTDPDALADLFAFV